MSKRWINIVWETKLPKAICCNCQFICGKKGKGSPPDHIKEEFYCDIRNEVNGYDPITGVIIYEGTHFGFTNRITLCEETNPNGNCEFFIEKKK